MKNLFYIALFGMVALMSQSCGGASHKNSDSEASDAETENAATEKEESSESSSGISFKTIPKVFQPNKTRYPNRWLFTSGFSLIVCDNSGTPIMYDDEMGETYDSYAFAFFCAHLVAGSYANIFRTKFDEWTPNSPTEALNKWESDFAPKIDPYLALCLNMPVDANVCPPLIQDWFNRVYYDYKDKDMYLSDSGYGVRDYRIGGSGLRIYRYDDENFPEYHGALAISYRY